MLDITEIRIKKIDKGNFLGYANICISDDFIIRDIKLFDGKNGRYIIMPGARLKKENRFRNFAYPIKDEVRKELLEKISKKYDEEN